MVLSSDIDILTRKIILFFNENDNGIIKIGNMKKTVGLIILFLIGIVAFNIWWEKEVVPERELFRDMQVVHTDVEDPRLGYTLLWEIRKTLAAYCWMQAEVYFHGGIRHMDEVHDHHHPEESCHHHHDITDEHLELDEEHHIECDHEHEIRDRTLLRPYVPRPDHGVEHVPQMMPWYWLTTLLDPYFIEAYHNGAYYLAFHLDRPGQAFEYLDRGLRYNPGEPRILTVYGWVYYRKGQYARTLYYLEKVDPQRLEETHEDAFSFDVFYYQLKADAFENLEKYQDALENWEKVYALTRREAVRRNRIEPLLEKISGQE